MSIVRETWAVCEGCGYREQVEDGAVAHPQRWPFVSDEDGKRYFCSRTCVLQSLAGGGTPARRVYPYGLTESDAMLLEHVALGLSNKEIGVRLDLAESTIKNHLTRINRKLGVVDRVQAVLRAHAVGVININDLSRRVAFHYDQPKAA